VYDNLYVKNIVFDDAGVCNYCRQIEDMKAKYKTGRPESEELLAEIAAKIKQAGRGKPYDCVMGVSGGSVPYKYSPTLICHRFYIGPNTVIAKGVRIGNGCASPPIALSLAECLATAWQSIHPAVLQALQVLALILLPISQIPHRE